MTTTVQDHTLEAISGVPEGYDALILAQRLHERARQRGADALILHVARDDRRLDTLEQALAFFAPDVRVIAFPAWETVPYDRVGPNADLVARRITALARLSASARKQPTIVLTTINAALQLVPSRDFIRKSIKAIAPGQRIDLPRLIQRLVRFGYQRTGTVMEPGEFAQRGGILDLFPPGRPNPVRLDFFGDTLEAIKPFDPETQRTTKAISKLVLMPVSEVAFGEVAVKRFRARYMELFGAVTGDDPLYEAVSAGTRFQGMEHWLPLFHGALEPLSAYVPDALISFDPSARGAIEARHELIEEHYKARVDALETATFGAPPYNPVPPSHMFVMASALKRVLKGHDQLYLLAFNETMEQEGMRTQALEGRAGRDFAAERNAVKANVFEAAAHHINARLGKERRVLIAAWSAGSRERISGLLREHGLVDLRAVEHFDAVQTLPATAAAIGVLGLDQGFETPHLTVIAEQDMLGDRFIRKRRKARKAVDVLTEATALSVGDLVVHTDHGIGRFAGLTTIEALGAPHACLELVYAGGDKLYLPVENIELLSRYGSDETTAQLDRLGGAAWQNRKAKLKKRLREIAAELIRVAAMRALREAQPLEAPHGAYDEFAAGFQHEETDDQQASIEAVLEDLASGKPMDRLVCGDVGFGKTEVAMRAAYVAAMSGVQVAVIVPTTLLARQHFRSFQERFRGLPVKIAQASRLVGTKDLTAVKAGLKDGQIDIVVGTHALLGKAIEFSNLGLLIVDEEQHFGVTHKERLKQLRDDVHVLTLTATPIPRTLQLALSGVRELSLITTPPVDRLAVRTFISPFDPVIIREALRRERFRGGQSFYVVPRIADLDGIAEFLDEHVPDLRYARAHGQLSPTELEDIMTAFYEGQYDVLLSTAIVESGLDVPNANTMIVHRADMFGLAQLYQLRGRVGRSKARAYAYFTTPASKRLTEPAEKRLKVLHSLDTLGAGFSLASHDLDIRGAGNLLGDEQSGHIKEVGFELYQSMLEETIASLKGGDLGEGDEQWSPQISLGTGVLIPDDYVSDLQLRLGLYRRVSALTKRGDIDDFAAELVDRFGPLPQEVKHLLDVMEIKALCRVAGVAQVDAGPKGGVLKFRNDTFAAPEALVGWLQTMKGQARFQADHKLIVKQDWAEAQDRVRGVRDLVAALAALIDEDGAAAMTSPASAEALG
ncbi:MAG: transcription-repair coupling factor [Pseudomonadota bacterium]